MSLWNAYPTFFSCGSVQLNCAVLNVSLLKKVHFLEQIKPEVPLEIVSCGNSIVCV